MRPTEPASPAPRFGLLRPVARGLALSALLACGGPPPPAAPDPAPVAPVVSAAPAAGSSPGGPDPRAMYAGCVDRVEGPSAAGECSDDAGCATAGCGGELCVSAATASSGLSTTCEQRPCFAALDRCTCQQGACTWTIKDSLPALPPHARPGPLPPRASDAPR